MLKKCFNLIEQVCNEQGIKIKYLSNNWILELKRNDIKKYIAGCKFGLNDHALGEIFDDKYATYDLLKSNNIPVVETKLLYSKQDPNGYAKKYQDYNQVLDFFEKNHNQIVIKSNNGTCGDEVFKITSKEEVIPLVENLFMSHSSLCYCPYYEIENEYRVIVLNKKVMIMYKKIKPVVYGDGVHSIKELLLNFNDHYFKNKVWDATYDRVLKKDEVFEYDWRFNLSKGACAKVEVDSNIINFVNKILDVIDIKFASIDVIKTIDNKYMVLEINSGVMMENLIDIVANTKYQDVPLTIYQEAIKELFK